MEKSCKLGGCHKIRSFWCNFWFCFFFQFSYKPKYMLFNKKKDGQINETVCLTSEQSSATASRYQCGLKVEKSAINNVSRMRGIG